MRKWIFLFSIIPSCVFSYILPVPSYSLRKEPWFGNAHEFEFYTDYIYSHFRKVNHGVHQLHHPWNVQQLFLGFDVATMGNFQGEVQLEFADSPKMRWGLRSSALQLRYLLLDQLMQGDPLNLAVGANLRIAQFRSLKDASSPYHGHVNGELNFSIGREWSNGPYWTLHPFAYLGVGQANKGYPWINPIFAFQQNFQDRHQYQVFLNGYFGFGGHKEVNIDHFRGYAKIQHRSIDIGGGYRYLFDIWGSITVQYAYRLWAKSFPENVNLFLIRYEIPFSLL
jgi:hypothetical protein